MKRSRVLQAAEQHLIRVDPVLGRVIERCGPCGLGAKARDPFHVLAMSIISQQLSSKAADTIAARVATLVGASAGFEPAHFTAATPEALRACGLSNAKAKWLRALGEAAASGKLSFAELDAMDDDEALEALDALPGIGRWTAEMFMMFALNRLDLFSMGDAGLRRAINILYGRGRPLSDKRTEAISRVWAPYRTVACWYLWRVVDPPAPA